MDVARLVFVGIEVSLLDDGREQAFAVCRVVYREVGVETESPGLLPQDAVEDGVERSIQM